MFNASEDLYDLIYSFKDYEREAQEIRNFISRHKPDAESVLDVACGTGKHLEFLTKHYAVDGIDLNERFVQIAAERNPSSNFWVADMTAFDLQKTYDVVMCLFSSIGYVRTHEAVKQTVKQFKSHLNDGGIVIVEPWFTPDQWQAGYVSVLNAERDDVKVCRMSHAEREGNLSVLNFEYLVGTESGIQHFQERHELGLFSHEELLQIFQASGLNVVFDSKGISGRGVYICFI
ncbi:class I SAM-dependent methyltransferase [Numidum massiliense]|uniref:class I SAM-dependent methyltransferase n=1 Tax=Numidum massiliense TaxID=1522315 RepID=UPI0006D55B65|nr:class I SAM-dependent methyltransferase [Numidum massiliense]